MEGKFNVCLLISRMENETSFIYSIQFHTFSSALHRKTKTKQKTSKQHEFLFILLIKNK